MNLSKKFKTCVILPKEEWWLLHSKIKKNSPIFPTLMGKLQSSIATQKIITEYKPRKIALIGFCGGLKGLKRGEVLEPNRIFEGDFDARPLAHFKKEIFMPNKFLGNSSSCVLVTQDKFLTRNIYGKRFSSFTKVAVDMESYAVALTAMFLGVEPIIIRIVSDIVGEKTHSNFKCAFSQYKMKLFKIITEVLDGKRL